MKYTLPTIVSMFLLLILSVGAYAYFIRSNDIEQENNLSGTSTQAYLCNGDGMRCPDGTIVGRTGPMCQFTECPGVVPAGGTSTVIATGILYGQVTIYPVCPVEYNPPKAECAPRAFVSDVTAIDESTGADVGAGQTTDSKGRFVMDLFPGEYIIKTRSAQVYSPCPDVKVRIYAHASSSVSIQCDSGIR